MTRFRFYIQVRLVLLDTAGQEEYDRIRPAAYSETDVILMCFSVDSPNALENISKKWEPELKQFFPHVPIILVGTKADLRNDPNTIEVSGEKKAGTTSAQNSLV